MRLALQRGRLWGQPARAGCQSARTTSGVQHLLVRVLDREVSARTGDLSSNPTAVSVEDAAGQIECTACRKFWKAVAKAKLGLQCLDVQAKRWTCYGKDRVHVSTSDGTKVGWLDLRRRVGTAAARHAAGGGRLGDGSTRAVKRR